MKRATLGAPINEASNLNEVVASLSFTQANGAGTYTAEAGRTAEKIPGNGTHLRIVPHDLIWADGVKSLNADGPANPLLGVRPLKPKRQTAKGKLQQVFEAASKLPRRQQDKVAEFVPAFVLHLVA